jgi:hypothetical protein
MIKLILAPSCLRLPAGVLLTATAGPAAVTSAGWPR